MAEKFASESTDTTNNFLAHADRDKLNELRAKGDKRTTEESRQLVELETMDQMSDGLLDKYKSGKPLSNDDITNLNAYVTYYAKQEGMTVQDAARYLKDNVLARDYGYPYAGSAEQQNAYMDQVRTNSIWGSALGQLMVGRPDDKSANEKTFSDAQKQGERPAYYYPNDSYLPSSQASQGKWTAMDAASRSATGAAVYLGCITNWSDSTCGKAAAVASAYADVKGSIAGMVALPKMGMGRAFGETTASAPPQQADGYAINKGQQNKHIPGTNEYKIASAAGVNKSVLTVAPETLIKKAGSGQQVGDTPVGMPGSKERVNYGNEIIGNYVDPSTGISTPTSNGIIHYAKDGVHIVPARP